MFKKILFGLLLAAAVTAAALVFLKHVAVPPQFFRAPGKTVTLEQITYGTTNACFASHSWQKWLYRLLPAKYKHVAGCTIINCTTPYTNNPVFWVRVKNVSDKPMDLNYATFKARLIDEYGDEYDANGYSQGDNLVATGECISYYELGLLPPHGRLAGICFYDPTTNQEKLGQLLIPGESITPFSNLKLAASEPQKFGEMTFQLTGLVTGLRTAPDRTSGNVNNPIKPIFSQAIFRITRNGAPAVNWVPMYLEVRAMDGAFRDTGQHVYGTRGDECFDNLEGLLDPTAGPVKLQVRFDHFSGFSPDELVTFKHMRFPGAGETNEPNVKLEAEGLTLKVERLKGGSGPGFLGGSAGNPPCIEVAMDPDLPDVRKQFVSVTDEQGVKLNLSGYASTGDGHLRIDLQPDATPKYVDLTFAVVRSQSASFVATPVMYSTNAAAVK